MEKNREGKGRRHKVATQRGETMTTWSWLGLTVGDGGGSSQSRGNCDEC